MSKILMLSTPRTGSNLLCECLTQTGQIGHVDGFFVGFGEGIKNRYAENVDLYYHGHVDENTGAFATKIMWDYIDHMADRVKYKTVYDVFFRMFDTVVWLYRKDTIAQAVSWYIAINSGKWTSKNDQKRPFPEYDFDYISWFIGKIQSYNERTRHFIETSGLEFRDKIAYEDIAHDIQGAVNRVLGTDDTYHIAPSLKRQENPLKAEFIKRYQEDLECQLALQNSVG